MYIFRYYLHSYEPSISPLNSLFSRIRKKVPPQSLLELLYYPLLHGLFQNPQESTLSFRKSLLASLQGLFQNPQGSLPPSLRTPLLSLITSLFQNPQENYFSISQIVSINLITGFVSENHQWKYPIP